MNGILNVARTVNISCKRYLSSGKLPSEIVVPLSRDMIVCWHPEREFPYEYSVPLPQEKRFPSNSVLCIDEKEAAKVFQEKRQEVVIDELAKITFTTRHRWYPRKKIYRSRKIEPDRPYL